jgi:protein-disulfide isomerase
MQDTKDSDIFPEPAKLGRPRRRPAATRRKRVDEPVTDPLPAAPIEPSITLAANSAGRSFQKFSIPIAILTGAIIIGIAIILALGPFFRQPASTQFAVSNPQGSSKQQPVTVAADGPSLGQANAPVVIIEFSDFQCPFCRAFWRDTLPTLTQNYIATGKARLVYRNFPIAQLHPSAQIAALAGQCALAQNKFWPFHDQMFSQQDKQGPNTVQFSAADLKKWAKDTGLNTSQFNSCLDTAKYDSVVKKDMADGTAAGVTGTPTFFVNGQMIVGAQGYQVFATAVDQALDKKK